MEQSIILLFCVYHAEHGEKKRRELPEEVIQKIKANQEQYEGYKSISRDLDVPVSAVVIKKFKVHGTDTNLTGHKRKVDQRLQRRID